MTALTAETAKELMKAVRARAAVTIFTRIPKQAVPLWLQEPPAENGMMKTPAQNTHSLMKTLHVKIW